MFCPSCGKEVPNAAGFCPHCGSDLTSRRVAPKRSGRLSAGDQKAQRKHRAKKGRLLPVVVMAAVALIAVTLVIAFNPFGGGGSNSGPSDTGVNSATSPQAEGSDSSEPEQDTPDVHAATEWDPETGSISNEHVSLTNLKWETADDSALPPSLRGSSTEYRFTCTAENLTDSSTSTALIVSGTISSEDEFGQAQVKPYTVRLDGAPLLDSEVEIGRACIIPLAPHEKREVTFFGEIPTPAEGSDFLPAGLKTTVHDSPSSYLPLDDPSLAAGDDGGVFEVIVNGAGGQPTLTDAADLTFTNTTEANLSRVTVAYHYAYDGVVAPKVFTWEWVNLAPDETVSSKQDLLNEIDGGVEDTKWNRGGRFLGDIFDAEGLAEHLEVVPFQIVCEEAA